MSSQFSPYDAMQNQVGASQRLADVMRMQSLQPIESASNHPGAALSWSQALAKVLQGYVGGKAADNAMQKQTEVAQRMQGDAESGLAGLDAGLRSEDPKRAIFEALAHPHPSVRSAGAVAQKGLLNQRDLSKLATPASVLANPDNSAGFVPKKALKTLTPGHVISDEAGNLVNPTSVQEGAGPNIIEKNGDLFQQTATGLDLVTKAPRISNTTQVNMPRGENAFEATFGAEQAKMLSGQMAERNTVVNALDSISEAQQLLKEGIHSGILADLAKGIDKTSIALFNTDPAKAARTERFKSAVGDIVLGRTKDLTGVISNSDREYLEDISAGKITAEPQALKGILKRIDEGMRKKVRNTDKAIEQYQSRGKTLPTIDAGVAREIPSKEATGQPEDFDSYMKRMGY